MEILFFIIFFNLIENGFARRIQGLKGFNRLNHSRRKDRKGIELWDSNTIEI